MTQSPRISRPKPRAESAREPQGLGIGRWRLAGEGLELDRVAARLLRLRRRAPTLEQALARWPVAEAARLRSALDRRGGFSLSVTTPGGRLLWRGAPPAGGAREGIVLPDDAVGADTATPSVTDAGRDAWFAGISHELRTPLNAILGFTQLARADASPAAGRHYLVSIEESSRLMLRVVNDLLDLASLEAGRLDIEPDQPLSLPRLFTRVCAQLAALRGDAPVRIYGSVDPRCPLHLRGDAGRLEQVLLNLAANALKFTPQGDVVLAARVRRLEATRVALRLSVADTGLGIGSEQLSRLGQAFERADAARLGRAGGTGLGLALVRRLLEMHGTRLQVASVSGGGTMMWFDLEWPLDPLAPAEQAVVEDRLFTDDLRLADTVATQWRSQGRQLGSPADAVTAGRWIVDQAHPQWSERVAQAREEGRPFMLVRAGAAPRVPGPVDAEVVPLPLLSAAAFGEPADHAASGHDPALKGLDVLVVEDNALSQRVLGDLLAQLGVTARIAGDGRGARQAARERMPDLVLMDIQLPDQTGFECADDLLRMAGGRAPALLFLSAHAGAEERARAMAMGARGCLGKPFEAAELKAWLRRIAAQVKGQPPRMAEPVRQAVDESTPVAHPAVADELLTLFARLWPDWRRQIETAPDPVSLRRAVHALRGGLAAMGEVQARDLARRIEEALAAGLAAPAGALHELLLRGDALAEAARRPKARTTA